ncbi:Na+/H+ antiporter subunit E [Actinomycetospora sp. CA-101289]|uniref:Na+/H+ antiporter subunit E n=1 Tax=Actinomycetospora sp. CA-101289 TaxID=3239893 RepID=UPI003D96D567
MIRAVGEVVAWSVVLVGVWTATLTVATGGDVLVGVLCAVPVGIVARLARRALGPPVRPPAEALRWLALLPAAVVGDLFRLPPAVLRAAGRAPGGTGEFRDVPVVRPDSARATWAAWILSASPGSYAVDVDDRRLRVHALSDRPSHLERAVSR